MSISLQLNQSASGAGVSQSFQKTLTGNAAIPVSRTLAAAKTGVVANSGTEITAQASHGIATGNTVDIYWAAGARYNVTVGTVAGTTVPISGGAGDAIPADATAVTIMVQTVTDFIVDGDDLVALVIYTPVRAIVTLKDSGGVELAKVFLEAGFYVWYSTNGETNPVAGDDITLVTMTHASSAGSYTITVDALYN